ncbi:hypothetical protein AGMMS49992_20140 [Clostridia bacterium]|nr:hypothetical protein AGMMS49992_20140 [Clostridia bacterium]
MAKPVTKRKGKTLSRKMSADELVSMIETACKKAIEGAEDEQETAVAAVEAVEEAEEQEFESSLQNAIESVLGKRKALSDAGEALEGDVSAEEIIAEMAAMIDATGVLEEDEEEEKDEDEDAREDGTAFPSEAPEPQKSRKMPVTRKSASYPTSRKAAQAYETPLQRKYASLFMTAPSMTSAPNEAKSLSPYAKLARSVKCGYWGNGDPDRSAYHARKSYGDANLERSYKALNATNPIAGGYLIPEVYADEIIQLLYDKTFLFEIGAIRMAMPNGNLTIPRFTVGSRATWNGEMRSIKTTEPGFGAIKMTAKQLSAIIPSTRELMQFSAFSNDEAFGADLARRISLGLETGALYGKGGSFEPLGIINTPDVTTIDVSTITDPRLVNSDHITADLIPIIRATALKKNIPTDHLGWVFNSEVEAEIMNAVSPFGDYTYRYEMSSKGTLLGAKFITTNLVTNNDDGTAKILFGNWSNVIVGDAGGLEVESFREGSVVNESGQTFNALQDNGIILRAVMHADIALQYPESIVVVDNVTLSYNL